MQCYLVATVIHTPSVNRYVCVWTQYGGGGRGKANKEIGTAVIATCLQCDSAVAVTTRTPAHIRQRTAAGVTTRRTHWCEVSSLPPAALPTS